jgi:hypothetical protein
MLQVDKDFLSFMLTFTDRLIQNDTTLLDDVDKIGTVLGLSNLMERKQMEDVLERSFDFVNDINKPLFLNLVDKLSIDKDYFRGIVRLNDSAKKGPIELKSCVKTLASEPLVFDSESKEFMFYTRMVRYAVGSGDSALASLVNQKIQSL